MNSKIELVLVFVLIAACCAAPQQRKQNGQSGQKGAKNGSSNNGQLTGQRPQPNSRPTQNQQITSNQVINWGTTSRTVSLALKTIILAKIKLDTISRTIILVKTNITMCLNLMAIILAGSIIVIIIIIMDRILVPSGRTGGIRETEIGRITFVRYKPF
jgi:hypothetical protein